ncbi:putative methyltransferase DDB_G0268948 [Saccostrea echinata]|uniref:putative methyltransferase DDB_G0268948 n=1 Tax=Saccostrea echinata TaxID=191078 RepID=UPI002A81BE23|nr:putative methyltransferase DDB_G0268948 [Saccostrea echinata]
MQPCFTKFRSPKALIRQIFLSAITLSRKMELFVGSEHSDLYQKYRPTYPPELYAFIANFCKTGRGSLDTAVDVGCGTGLSTLPLCKYFNKVIGVDVSETQINTARTTHRQSNLMFHTSNGEQLQFLSDCSVDLVTVAQAMHWIEPEPFYREVTRILRPSGSLVVYGYGINTIDSNEGNKIIDKFYSHDLEGFWDSRRRHIDNLYQEISLPFSGSERISDFVIQNRWSVSDVVGYLSTWSAWQRYLKQHPDSNLLVEIQRHLENIYQDQKITITWPVFVLLGRKESEKKP